MTVADWLVFAGLMGGMMGGGASALAWLLTRLNRLELSLSNRLTRVETLVELAFPEAKERAQILESSRRATATVRNRSIFGAR